MVRSQSIDLHMEVPDLIHIPGYPLIWGWAGRLGGLETPQESLLGTWGRLPRDIPKW